MHIYNIKDLGKVERERRERLEIFINIQMRVRS